MVLTFLPGSENDLCVFPFYQWGKILKVQSVAQGDIASSVAGARDHFPLPIRLLMEELIVSEFHLFCINSIMFSILDS